MKTWSPKQLSWLLPVLTAPFLLSGCGTVGGAASDVGLAGLGGVAGYELSGGSVGGAAIGAGAGYVASKVAQAGVKSAMTDAEQRGYDRALNQAVKQQYWIIQNQQRSYARADDMPRYRPIQLPELKINGVVEVPTVAYLKEAP